MRLARAKPRKWRDALVATPLMGAAAVFSLLAAVYWLAIASDRYVSEARVIVQRTDLIASATPDITSILTGSGNGSRSDQMVMRDYLLSQGVVDQLERKLHLWDHYTAWNIDPFSRLSFANSREDLYAYYLDRVSVEYDEYGGVLVIRAQAFSPKMAQQISSTLVSMGEHFMNTSAHDLAENQVKFLEEQVAEINKRSNAARQAVIAYQNREGIVSPTGQAEAIAGIVAQLEGKRTELQTKLAAQKAFLVDDHPSNIALEQQIAALSAQIDQENAKLAAPQGGRLNSKVEQFQRLEEEAKFEDQLYRSALAALEKERVESTRKIKQLTIIQPPSLPQESELPRRFRMAVIYALLTFLIAGVAQLLVMIVKDHRD